VAFYEPATVAEAVRLLDELGDDAKVVAGGTAIAILLRQRLIAPAALVSIGRLPGLDTIDADAEALHIGALARHRDVELSPIVRARVPVLADAFSVVANVRVRNAATVGGVLAEADYASDPPAVFLVLDAEVEVEGPNGQRRIPIADFFVAFYETAIAANELVTGIRVPIPAPGTSAIYEKFVTRSSEDRPCVGVAAVTRLADDGTCTDLRVAVGAAAETPQRFPDIEATALGRRPDEALLQSIAEAYADRIEPLDDMRGTSWYRTEMVRVWVRRALARALAAGSPGAGTTAPA
jgi:carbon-monoxide dehydrogenase medium subunit